MCSKDKNDCARPGESCNYRRGKFGRYDFTCNVNIHRRWKGSFSVSQVTPSSGVPECSTLHDLPTNIYHITSPVGKGLKDVRTLTQLTERDRPCIYSGVTYTPDWPVKVTCDTIYNAPWSAITKGR